MAGLTVAVTEAAEEHAKRSPGGRLPVPMLAVLDEAANVCRWPELPNLYSHYGSRGIPGITVDGGYADVVVIRASAMASMPDDLAPEEAPPLMCAGITTYNGLRRSGLRGGDRVAVLGIGGLGHLGVQFAVKLGMETVAIARGADKEPLSRELGATSTSTVLPGIRRKRCWNWAASI